MSPKVSRASEARPGTQLSRNRGPGSAAHHFVVRCVRDTCFAIIALFLAGLISAHAQPADTVLLNGKIVQYGAAPAEALAVRDGKIMAVGTTADIRALAGSNTRAIDLDGSTVIAGLIDSHIHAIRAGLTFTTEVHWIGARSLADALGRIRAAAEKAPKGSWLIVAGGWTERQFAEGRRPTQAEIAAAAPGHNVYVQILYSAILLSPGGAEALGIAKDQGLMARLTVEKDNDGKPTGWVSGDNRAISDVFNLLPRPTFAQQVAGTRAFFRALNSLGITGVLDPGGYNMPIEEYRALFQVWRDRALTVRVAYSLCAPRRGHELEDLAAMTEAMPMGFGDDWLRFNGIGENVVWGMYNNEKPSEADRERLTRLLQWAAPRGLTATFHWHNESSVHHLLDVLERINRETPVAPLRWSVAHLNDASPDSLRRLKAMGIGWLMQNAFYFRGEAFVGQRGADAARLSPPIASALRLGLQVGGGTDAHRVMNYNPFVSLQWMLDGKTVGGMPMRGPEEMPTREEALRIYTLGSAWFSFDDEKRGSLAPGKLADLAVLTKDYLSVPVEEIGAIASLLTMVGGRVVYATGPYAALEEKGAD
jgi:predicted amidohydrolase YtcJ